MIKEQIGKGNFIMNAYTRYPGSKWNIARKIIGLFPEHHSYLEPFLGCGAVLLTKKRSDIETVNDIDGDVVNFFSQLRRNPERFAYEIYCTPYARQVYDEAFIPISRDDFQRAVQFYIRLNMGYGAKTTGEKVGWKNDIQGREKAYAVENWKRLPDQLLKVAERFRGVQIEHMQAEKLIPRFNNSGTLIYVDPPYLLEARGGRKYYRSEMGDTSSHVNLLEILKQHRGPVVISGYDSEIYNSCLKGWHKESINSYTQNRLPRTEVLWMNFVPAGQQMSIDEWLNNNICD